MTGLTWKPAFLKPAAIGSGAFGWTRVPSTPSARLPDITPKTVTLSSLGLRGNVPSFLNKTVPSATMRPACS